MEQFLSKPDYIDDYPTCAQTSVTLRIYSKDLESLEIGALLKIAASETQSRKTPISTTKKGSVIFPPLNGWFLESSGKVKSRDVRRHLDWILDQIVPRARKISVLQKAGCIMDVYCSWTSKHQQGGPTLSPRQMQKLAKLNLDCTFEIW